MTDPVSLEHPKVLAVEIDPDFEWDTHDTGGEHAMKESGAWRTFVGNLETSGGQLPAHAEDSFDHYLFGRNGTFYRAYPTSGGPMVAGWAASHTAGRGLTIDAMWAQNPYEQVTKAGEAAVNARVAGGLSEILIRKVFDNYCGLYGLPALRYLRFPFAHIESALMPQGSAHPYKQNFGVKRSLAGLAITTDESYVIPLPNRIITPRDDLNETALGELKEAMPEGFDGGLIYSTTADPEVTVEEFYRRRTHIGTLLITWSDMVEGPTTQAMTANGQKVELPSFARDDMRAANRVSLLKVLAERDSEIASLILDN